MLRAGEVVAKGDWHGEAADRVVLDFDDRHRRRVTMTGVGGLCFLLDLHETVALRSGDAVRLDDGRLVEIIGAPEALAEIRAPSLEQLLRLAWHLGNRHLPVEIAGNRLRIRRDHVIEAMIAELGGAVRPIEAAFAPDGGAYLEAKHNHTHEHGHARKHDHKHDHAHEHAHGEACGCGHDHHEHQAHDHKTHGHHHDHHGHSHADKHD